MTIRSEETVAKDLDEIGGGNVGGRIADCLAQALGEFDAKYGSDPELSVRTQRGVIWDYAAAFIRAEFEDDHDIDVRDQDGTVYVDLQMGGQKKYSGRIKGFDGNMRPSNIPTRVMSGFLFQRSVAVERQAGLPFPDYPPSSAGRIPVTSLLFGYAAEPGEWLAASFHVVCPNGKDNAWELPLEARTTVIDFAAAARTRMRAEAEQARKQVDHERRFEARGESKRKNKKSEDEAE